MGLHKELIDRVPADGSTIGNGSLRKVLDWDVDRYQHVRDELVAAGTIRLGRGRGGTVSLVQPQTSAPATQVTVGKRRERGQYAGFRRGLAKWAAAQGWNDYFVEQTADQGSRSTGGKFTRPDFVVAGVRQYEYTPWKTRDLETFELKLSNCKIDAVFETAAHSRCATRSHLAIVRDEDGPNDQDLDRIASECQRLGLGLVLIDDPETPDAWDYRVEPLRQEPDPEALESFVKTQVSGKERLRKWLH